MLNLFKIILSFIFFYLFEDLIFKIKVLKKSKVSDNENYDSNKFNFIISYQNQLLNNSRSNLDNAVYQVAKETSDIVDNRSLYY